MATIQTKARKLRLEYAARQGRPVTAREVADAIGAWGATLTAGPRTECLEVDEKPKAS